MKTFSKLDTLSDRAIRQALNKKGSISHAAIALGCGASTVRKAIMDRKINWKPGEHARAMFKAAASNPNVKEITPHHFEGIREFKRATKAMTKRTSKRPSKTARKPKFGTTPIFFDAPKLSDPSPIKIRRIKQTFTPKPVSDLPGNGSSNGSNGAIPKNFLAYFPDDVVKSVLKELIIEGHINISAGK